MKKRMGSIGGALLAMLGVFVYSAEGQKPAAAPAAVPRQGPVRQAAPVTNVTVDGSEAMFTTMCALYAAGFQADISADNWSTFRARMREQARQQRGPAVDAMREFYQQHKLKDAGAMLSRYVWFGLVSGPAPKFQPVLRRDELPPEVLELEGFSEILSSYYTEQKIGALWQQVQPEYNRTIERLHESISQIVLVSTVYLREMPDSKGPRTFTILIEPLVGRITNVRNYGDHYSIILSGGEDVPTDVVRHAFLHFLMDPLPLMYPHVVVVKRPVYELAAKAPLLPANLREDYFSWFSECMVRAVELKLKRDSPGEKEALLRVDDSAGLVMVRPLFAALTGFEKSEPSMKIYFPELVRGIDLKAEQARVAALVYARAGSQEQAEKLSEEDLSKRRGAAVTTVPNDQEMLSALTEGEKQIAAKNARGAETSFKAVLAKYPDQIRAWYGLGLVAVLDEDSARAKEIFGRLTTGENAATQDPMVLAWSHIWLGRILASEGQLEQAKNEYQLAIDVKAAPAQAEQAAKRGMSDLETRKPAERP
jgi:tetratricopeptide (TPR) repeat protein